MDSPADTKRTFARRYLDGWQAGLVILLLAGSAVVLAVPGSVEPREPPAPLFDGSALQATMAADDARALGAEREVLDVDIRAVGRELRAYNQVTARGAKDELMAARRRLVQATGRALGRSVDQLLTLRAYQLKRFLSELRRWQQTGVRSEELAALGGDFLQMVARNLWCRGQSRELLLDERVLRVIYKKRWNDVTGASSQPFALTLDEDRVRFGFLIRHPWLPRPALAQPRPELRELLIEQERLKMIAKLQARDESYPADLAQGVVLYRMGRYGLATDAFRRHLSRHEHGPYTLLAQNYLKAALDYTSQGIF